LFDGQSVGQGVTFRGTSAPYGAEIEYRVTGSNGGAAASILIQDVAGDTVRTLTGPAANGLQRVTWDFRRNPAPARPLSPAQRRDSIVTARRTEFVFDSLRKAGTDTTALGRVRRAMLAQGAGGRGNGAFGGGRGRGASDVWVERPGENFNTGGRGGRGGGGRGGAAITGPDSTLAAIVAQLIQNPGGRAGRGGRGGGGGAFGGAGAAVLPGDYLVTVRIGEKTAKTVLRVERADTIGGDTASQAGDNPASAGRGGAGQAIRPRLF
jgi:hypothetical protein